MKRFFLALLTLGILLASGTAAAQQATNPTITSFTSSVSTVDRNALANRTARIPVSWTTANRPDSANLVFDQILPDGRVMNVELPRDNPWVPSSGNGVVAPFPPGENATSIKLRVSLIDAVKIVVHDVEEIDISIGDSTVVRPVISVFSTSASEVSRQALTNKTARLPVTFAVENRPDNSNLVFEQVLENNSVVNVELPRQNPIVPSSGNGVVAPVAPQNATTKTITLRLRLVSLSNNQSITQKDITVSVTETTQPAPTIRTFTTSAQSVILAALQNNTARVPVTFAVDNRPNNSNLVFEQVLEDNSVVNVELPRPNPIVPSSGTGVAAPVAPKNSATTSITLRLRVIDLGSQAMLAQQTLTIPITAPPAATIRTFSTTSTGVALTALNSKTARVPVAFAVENRPDNSNLVFEQVLEDNSVVNVELPRQNPIVPSSGNGVVAPVAPQTAGTARITLRLRVINLTSQATLVQQTITVPIVQLPEAPVIRTFITPAGSVFLTALQNRTARLPVSWLVDNRFDGTNLVFEQVFEDNSVINIELPRQNPIIPSEGNGVVAPIAPKNTTTTSITLRLRLVDLGNQGTLTQKDITLPIQFSQLLPVIRSFTTTVQNVSRQDLAGRSARLPVSWNVENRPDNSNLVFEQVLENNTAVNIELPRPNPLVPSSGNGVVAPVSPLQSGATSITLRLRVLDLTTQDTLTQQTVTVPIIDANTPTIRSFTSASSSVENGPLVARTARIGVSWDVVNRPPGSNLVFEQVLDNNTVVNIELPRQNPLVASSGIGTVAPVAPLNATTRSILIRLRLINLSNNQTITQSEISLPISGRPGMPEGVWQEVADRTQCYSGDFPADSGLAVGKRGQVIDQANAVSYVSNAPLGGQIVGELPARATFSILEGPRCYRILGVSTRALTIRYWRVKAEASAVEGWVNEYTQATSSGAPQAFIELATDTGGAQPVQIVSFSLTPDPVDRGGAVTIGWNVSGSPSSVKIIRLSEFGNNALETILDQQPAGGSAPYTLPDDYINSASFQISVTDASGRESIQNAQVKITCPFTDTLEVSVCPQSVTEGVNSAFQAFEKGYMIWRGDTQKIYVLYSDDQSWREFDDTWNGETLPDPGAPPAGLVAPQRGFGKIWNEIAGASVLGWALAEELPYQGRWEIYPVTDAGQVFYAPSFTLPDGRYAYLGLVWEIKTRLLS
jgi:hypothetical protein